MPPLTARHPAALGAAGVLAAAALWGSLGLFGRLAFAHGVTPVELASVRAALAFLAVLPLALLRPRDFRVRRADLPLLVAYGTVSVGLFYFLYMEAVERLPLAAAAALLYTAPAFVVALSWLARWEPVRPGRLLPLAMVLAGAALVTGAWRAVPDLAPAGAAFGLASGLAYALYTVLGKRIRRRYDVATTILWAYGIGAAVLALAAPPWRVLLDHPPALGVILLMTLGPTLLAAVLFYFGIHHVDASTASMLATVEPVVAAFLGVAWLGEALSPSTVAGTALILAAALWLGRERGDTNLDPSPPS